MSQTIENTTAAGTGPVDRPVGRRVEEHDAIERLRARFDASYGEMADVMRAALAWRSKWADYQRPYNAQMEQPVLESDVDAAECRMLEAVRSYARSKTPNK